MCGKSLEVRLYIIINNGLRAGLSLCGALSLKKGGKDKKRKFEGGGGVVGAIFRPDFERGVVDEVRKFEGVVGAIFGSHF